MIQGQLGKEHINITSQGDLTILSNSQLHDIHLSPLAWRRHLSFYELKLPNLLGSNKETHSFSNCLLMN